MTVHGNLWCRDTTATWQVCDQPHPLKVAACVKACLEGNIDGACSGLSELYSAGYAASDIITTLFRIVKSYDMPEALKLEFIRVSYSCIVISMSYCFVA